MYVGSMGFWEVIPCCPKLRSQAAVLLPGSTAMLPLPGAGVACFFSSANAAWISCSLSLGQCMGRRSKASVGKTPRVYTPESLGRLDWSLSPPFWRKQHSQSATAVVLKPELLYPNPTYCEGKHVKHWSCQGISFWQFFRMKVILVFFSMLTCLLTKFSDFYCP